MGRKKGTAIFIASACVSLVVMGCLLLLFLLYMKTTAQAEAVKKDVPYEESYQPGKDESLEVVLLGCEEAESLPELVLLFAYDAPKGIVKVVGIPSRVICTVDDRTDTLAGHYDYEGVRGAVNAVRSLLSQDVDRYLRTQRTGLSNLVDFLGGVELNPEGELHVGGLTLSPGRQLLDGRQVTEFTFVKDSYQCTDVDFQVRLVSGLLEQRFRQRLTEGYDAFTDAIFYNCESNLSRYDFVQRKRGFTSYCRDGNLVIQSMVVEGEYNFDRSMFTADIESVESITEFLASEPELEATDNPTSSR